MKWHTEHETHSCDVLVVDDETATVELLVVYLTDKKVSARGITTSDDYVRDIQAANPRLLLLDVSMPGANGYRLCTEIKKNEQTRHIRVIMFSATSMAGVIQGAADSGADGYLLKPFSLADIDRLVDSTRDG